MANNIRSNSTTKHKAIALRQTPTPAEAKLWRYLRGGRLQGCSFRRQHAVGPFIADFCCIQKKLIIEVDGGQHAEQVAYDEERTRYLASRGYHVLRFWNNEVEKDIEGVLEVIGTALKECHHPPIFEDNGLHASPSSRVGED